MRHEISRTGTRPFPPSVSSNNNTPAPIGPPREIALRLDKAAQATWAALWGGAFAFAAGPAGGQSLPEAVALAYETNPTLSLQRQQVRLTDEAFVQARSGYRPQLNASATTSYSATTVKAGRTGLVDTNGDGAPDTSVGVSGVNERNFGNASITLIQPLYTGGRTAAAISAAEADILAARETLRDAEAGVLQAVVLAYADVRRDIRIVDVREKDVTTLSRQLDEAQATFDAGLVTGTDVAQARARLGTSRAQLAAARSQLEISRGMFAQVIGREPDNLEPKPSLEALLPQSLDDAFAHAEAENGRLRSAEMTALAARKRIEVAKAQRRPTISLRGSSGYSGQIDPFATDRLAQNVTASLTTTFPLYSGGLYASQVRQAVERSAMDETRVELTRRQIRQATRQAWSQLQAARAAVSTNGEVVKAATIATMGVRLEYEVGLRNTLDVLNAELELRNAELSLINARRDEYVASSAVLSAIGHLGVQTLSPDLAIYDSAASFERAHHDGLWALWDTTMRSLDELGPARSSAPIHRPPEPEHPAPSG